MDHFEFHALTPTGDEIRGTLSAADEAAAKKELARRELRVINLVRRDAERAGGLNEDLVDVLLQEIGGAAASRIPLEVSLAALAEENSDPRLTAIAEGLATRLQQGATIDEALKEVEAQLPSEIAGLLRSGVQSGDLAGVFERFSQQRLAASRYNRRIRATLAYPVIIVAILVPTLLFLCTYVIPIFGDIFREFRVDLPVATDLIIKASKQVPSLVVGLIVVLIGLPFALRVLGGRWMLHRVRAALPLVGRLWMWAGQREFASQLGSFLSMGLPMQNAIAHTAQVVSDRNVARACNRVNRRVENGQALSSSLDQSIQFDRSLVALVAWGERHGAVTEALAVASDLFDDRIEQQASLVRRLLPPLTLVSVATLIAFVLAGIMVPMVKLIEGLSK